MRAGAALVRFGPTPLVRFRVAEPMPVRTVVPACGAGKRSSNDSEMLLVVALSVSELIYVKCEWRERESERDRGML